MCAGSMGQMGLMEAISEDIHIDKIKLRYYNHQLYDNGVPLIMHFRNSR